MRTLVRLSVPLLVLVGCGGGSIDITALAAADISGQRGFEPPAGNRTVAVEVELTNDAGEDISLATSQFRLDPSSGVSVRASDLTSGLSDGCVSASGAVLPSGQTVRCSLAFDIPLAFEPVVIAFSFNDLTAEDFVPALTPPGDAGPADDAGPDEDAGPFNGDAGRRDAGPAPPPTDRMDLLLMIDNSNSLTEEQAALANQLPRLMTILTTGDADQDGDFAGDMEADDPDFPPIVSLNVGVIVPDMGVGGASVPTCMNPSFGEDGILRTQGNTSVVGCMSTYPTFLNFMNGGGTPIGDFARDAACVAQVGTGGCGFEQQLESVLKALSPAASNANVASFYSPPSFFQNTRGHGDGANNGFLRADSVLGIFVFTDEEDCSASDPDLFNPGSATYTADLNLRCFVHGNEALHPISRYVDGITQLREAPSRIAYVLVAGVPVDLTPAAGAPIEWDPLVSEDPATRDDRLEERIDPANPDRLLPSCNEPGTGLAFPPIRMLRVGRELERNGVRVGLSSICGGDLSGSIEALIQATGLAVRR